MHFLFPKKHEICLTREPYDDKDDEAFRQYNNDNYKI